MYPSQRWWISFPFLIALAVFVFLVWSVFEVFAYPYDGLLTIDPTGLIKEIDDQGPTAEILSVGDRVITVDGVSFFEAQPFYAQKRAGQHAELVVQRGDATSRVSFQLVNPNFKETFSRSGAAFPGACLLGLGIGHPGFQADQRSRQCLFPVLCYERRLLDRWRYIITGSTLDSSFVQLSVYGCWARSPSIFTCIFLKKRCSGTSVPCCWVSTASRC